MMYVYTSGSQLFKIKSPLIRLKKHIRKFQLLAFICLWLLKFFYYKEFRKNYSRTECFGLWIFLWKLSCPVFCLALSWDSCVNVCIFNCAIIGWHFVASWLRISGLYHTVVASNCTLTEHTILFPARYSSAGINIVTSGWHYTHVLLHPREVTPASLYLSCSVIWCQSTQFCCLTRQTDASYAHTSRLHWEDS